MISLNSSQNIGVVDYDSDVEWFLLQGEQYWKNFWNIFEDYLRHPENKFDGDIGVLKRKDVWISDVTNIGKESNGLDESELLGLDEDSYVEYSDIDYLERKFRDLVPQILELKPKDVREFGVSRQSLWNIKNKIKTKELCKISAILKGRLLQSLITINVD